MLHTNKMEEKYLQIIYLIRDLYPEYEKHAYKPKIKEINIIF